MDANDNTPATYNLRAPEPCPRRKVGLKLQLRADDRVQVCLLRGDIRLTIPAILGGFGANLDFADNFPLDPGFRAILLEQGVDLLNGRTLSALVSQVVV